MDRTSPPEVNLNEQFEKEAKDEDMRKYLLSLGLDPNYVPPQNDPRRVVVSKLEIIFKERPANPAVLTFATAEDIKNAKDTVLVMKEGCEFKIRVHFRVQHNVVLGLRLNNQVKKIGATLAKDVEMLGTYPPKNEFAHVDLPRTEWNEAESGMLARGEYTAKMDFVDDDNKTHLSFDYKIKVAKDWE